MSITFDGANGTYATRTASVWDHNSPYTVTMWVKPNTFTVNRTPFIIHISNLETNADWFRTKITDATVDHIAAISGSYGVVNSSPVALSAGVWVPLAYVRTAVNNADLWIGGTTALFHNTKDITGRGAATALEVGTYSNHATYTWDGSMAQKRVWQSALSDAEIIAEFASATRIKTGAWADWPLANSGDYADHSGNGRDLTFVGNITTGADDPSQGGSPVNINAATIAAIGAIPEPTIQSSVLLGGSELWIPSIVTLPPPTISMGTMAAITAVPIQCAVSLPVPSISWTGQPITLGGNSGIQAILHPGSGFHRTKKQSAVIKRYRRTA